MTNDKYLLETFLMEYPRAGIIAVIHRNYRIAMFGSSTQEGIQKYVRV